MKMDITAQSGPVIYSFYATACNPHRRWLLFVDMFLARNARASRHNRSPHYDGSGPEPHSLDGVRVLLNLYITTKSGSVILSILTTRNYTPERGSMILVLETKKKKKLV